MADKTIYQLPLETTLDGSYRSVLQKSGTSLQDNGFTLSALASWIGQNANITLYGGSANPDNAVGNNRDIYLQQNGTAYQKVSGVWVSKVVFTGTQIIINLTSSEPADYDYHYTGPVTLTNLKIQAWQPFTDGTYGAVYVPYSITPLLIMSTGHIILRRSDVGDVVRVVIST